MSQGSYKEGRYFRSKNLKDHQDACPFGHEKASVRSRAFSMLGFLNTPGLKRLNWNFNNGTRRGEYSDNHRDVALVHHKGPPEGMMTSVDMGDDVIDLSQPDANPIDPRRYRATYSVKTAGEAAAMIAMIRTMPDPETVYDSIHVISEKKALPLSEMIAGEDWVNLGSSTQMREELGLKMPSVITANTQDAHVVENFAGNTFVVPRMTRGGDDANGDITGFRVLFMTSDDKAAEALTKGDKVAVQGYAQMDVPMLERQEFFELTGIDPPGDSVKYMVVPVRNADHVSAITADFETSMEDEPVYRADYINSLNAKAAEDDYDPDDPSTWYDDYGND